MNKVSLTEINAYTSENYKSYLEPLYEYSPWIVERSEELRPFDSMASMQATFERVIFEAAESEQIALLRAHPDLAAKIEEISGLTEFSKSEQAKAGFAAMPRSDLEALRSLLGDYRRLFGHPFILCVSDYDATQALPVLKVRIQATQIAEKQACLAQVARIGWHRLQQLLSD